jgi:PGF-pre-PGF domain-containing protein
VVALVDPVSNLSSNVTPGQTTLPVADFNANATSGYVPLSILFTDTSQNAEARDWDFNNDGIADSSDAIHVYVYTAPGNYTVNLKVSNTNGTASKTATITILKESNSSGDNSSGGSGSDESSHSSSSSGGAGGSPEPQSNVETKEISQAFVTSGNPVKFDFPRNATSVIYVSFDSKKTAGKTTTIVEMLKGKSILVSELPSDEVYKSLNIWVGNSEFATPNNIKNAVVCFKVKKSWIQDKKINQSSITLNTVLHQLDQKIIYPHYDFKHLTEKYFEIGMKLNDFSI